MHVFIDNKGMHVYDMCMHRQNCHNFQFFLENKLENKLNNSLVEDR